MKLFFSFVLVLATFSLVFSQDQTITADGDYTFSTPGSHNLILPAGMTATVTYKIWGGGGAGGYIVGANMITRNAGGGGGGYSIGGPTEIASGTYPIVVGAGGVVTDFSTTRRDGDDSSAFGDTGFGGVGGTNNPSAGGVGNNANGGAGGARGSLGNGTGGGGGGSGPGATDGSQGNASGGVGGSLGGGTGGDNGANGVSGSSPGGGGGGKGSGGSGAMGLTGGDGGDGQVIVTVTLLGPLPVELMNFTGQPLERTNLLEWETASEENNAHFEIERSVDGLRFEEIGKVEGKGTTFTYSTYSFVDKNPTSNGYYRLRQVDADGQFEYSNIIFIQSESTSNEVNVYPIPTQKNLFIDYNSEFSEDMNIQVIDITGRVVLTQTAGSVAGYNLVELDLSNLPQGTFFIKMESPTLSFTKKIVK